LCSLEKNCGVQAIAMSDFPRKFPQFTSCWKESANKTENGETTSPKKNQHWPQICVQRGIAAGEDVGSTSETRKGMALWRGENVCRIVFKAPRLGRLGNP
jgi:hypothetical protein